MVHQKCCTANDKKAKVTNLRFKFLAKWALQVFFFTSNIYAVFSLWKRSVNIVMRSRFLILDRYFFAWMLADMTSVKSCQLLKCISLLCGILKIRQMPTVFELTRAENISTALCMCITTDVMGTCVIWRPVILQPWSGCCFHCFILRVMTTQGSFGAQLLEGWWGHWAGIEPFAINLNV